MRNLELDRLRAALAQAKARVAQIESGQRGVRSGPWLETDGNAGAGRAYSAQLQAQRDTVTRLELEYVQAMIPTPWCPAAIIEAMEGPKRDTRASPTAHPGA